MKKVGLKTHFAIAGLVSLGLLAGISLKLPNLTTPISVGADVNRTLYPNQTGIDETASAPNQDGILEDDTDTIKNQIQVIQISATWCGACKSLEPKLVTEVNRLKKEGKSIAYVKRDFDANKSYYESTLKITNLPAVFIKKDGKELNRFVGSKSDAEIRTLLAQYFSNATKPLPNTTARATFIFTTSTINCPNCKAVSDTVNKLKKDFSKNIADKTLSFVDYDFEKNQDIFGGLVYKADLPLVILKVGTKEVGRYAGFQSYEALKGRIQEMLTQNQSGTTNNNYIKKFTFTEKDNKVNLQAEVSREVAKVEFNVTTKDKKNLKTTSQPNAQGIATATIAITSQSSGAKKTILQKLLYNPVPKAVAQTTPAAQTTNNIARATATGIGADGKPLAQATPNTDPDGNGKTDTVGSNLLGVGSLITSLNGLTAQQADGTAEGEIKARALNIINFMFALASALLMLAAIWTGILYIFSFGNEEQATKAKKNFINIIIALALLLASFTVVSLIRNLIENFKIGI